MKEFNLTLNVNEFIIDPRRTRQALILCKNSEGFFVLGRKDKYYPDGIARMVGGGINDLEDPKDGAARELHEELAINVSSENLQELCLVKLQMIKSDKEQPLDIFVYFYNLEETKITASDDVSSLVYLSLDEYQNMIKNLDSLQGIYPIKNGFLKPSTKQWNDWGKLYAFVHQKALECYLLKDF